MNKKSQIALSITFLLYIFGFFGLQIIAPDKTFSELENRNLARKPLFTLESFFNGEYGEKFETYTADQFPLRNNFISLKSYSELFLNKKENNGVYIGKDGYFLQDFKEPDIELAYRNAKYISDFAEEFNVSLLLAPTATKVLEGKLPPYSTPYDEGAYIEEFKNALSKKVNFIPVLDQLKAHPSEYLYYKTDHHWTTLGAYYAYESFCKSIGIEPLALNAFNITDVTNSFYGTLFSKGNFTFATPDTISLFEPKQTVDVEVYYAYTDTTKNSLYEYAYLDTKDKYSLFLDNNHPIITVKSSINNGKKLLVLKDSYANCFIPFLTNHYEEIHILDLRLLNMPIATYARQNSIEDVLLLYNVQNFSSEAKLSLLGK